MAYTSFTITQPFLGAPLQFVPALGSQELEQLIDIYVIGSAAKSDKLAQVTIDFYNNATVDLNTGALTKTYDVFTQNLWGSFDLSPANSFTQSPSSNNGMADSGYGSMGLTPPMKMNGVGSGRVSKKTKKDTRKVQEINLPGFSIMTKDGIDVTNTAGRGTKTREQREHAHLMRQLKACESCKRKKVKCDPSHRRASQNDMSRSSTSTGKTTSSFSSSSSQNNPSPASTTSASAPCLSRTTTQQTSPPPFTPSVGTIDDFVLFPEDDLTWALPTDNEMSFSSQNLGDFNFDLEFSNTSADLSQQGFDWNFAPAQSFTQHHQLDSNDNSLRPAAEQSIAHFSQQEPLISNSGYELEQWADSQASELGSLIDSQFSQTPLISHPSQSSSVSPQHSQTPLIPHSSSISQHLQPSSTSAALQSLVTETGPAHTRPHPSGQYADSSGLLHGGLGWEHAATGYFGAGLEIVPLKMSNREVYKEGKKRTTDGGTEGISNGINSGIISGQSFSIVGDGNSNAGLSSSSASPTDSGFSTPASSNGSTGLDSRLSPTDSASLGIRSPQDTSSANGNPKGLSFTAGSRFGTGSGLVSQPQTPLASSSSSSLTSSPILSSVSDGSSPIGTVARLKQSSPSQISSPSSTDGLNSPMLSLTTNFPSVARIQQVLPSESLAVNNGEGLLFIKGRSKVDALLQSSGRIETSNDMSFNSAADSTPMERISRRRAPNTVAASSESMNANGFSESIIPGNAWEDGMQHSIQSQSSGSSSGVSNTAGSKSSSSSVESLMTSQPPLAASRSFRHQTSNDQSQLSVGIDGKPSSTPMGLVPTSLPPVLRSQSSSSSAIATQRSQLTPSAADKMVTSRLKSTSSPSYTSSSVLESGKVQTQSSIASSQLPSQSPTPSQASPLVLTGSKVATTATVVVATTTTCENMKSGGGVLSVASRLLGDLVGRFMGLRVV